jgi:hypothetical protein
LGRETLFLPGILVSFFFHTESYFKKMKLTADLISNSLSQINPVGDRELVLRGKNKQKKRVLCIKLFFSLYSSVAELYRFKDTCY